MRSFGSGKKTTRSASFVLSTPYSLVRSREAALRKWGVFHYQPVLAGVADRNRSSDSSANEKEGRNMGPLLLHHPWVQFYVLLVGALWMVVLWNDYLRHRFRLRNHDPRGFPGDTGNHSSHPVLPDPGPWSQNASVSVGVGPEPVGGLSNSSKGCDDAFKT